MSAERRQPPIYTNRYLCPITGCGWHHDEPVRSDGPFAPWQGTLEATAFATVTAQVQMVDQAIAGHLATHPVLEWFREVRSQQDRADKAEAELERYRGLDAAANELLARNVELGTRAGNAEAKCEDLEDKVKRVRNDNEALIESCRKWMNQATVDFDRARDAGIELERMRAYTGPTVKIEWGVQDATVPVDPLDAVLCDSREDARRDAERYSREVLTNGKPTPYRVVTRLAGAWVEVPDA